MKICSTNSAMMKLWCALILDELTPAELGIVKRLQASPYHSLGTWGRVEYLINSPDDVDIAKVWLYARVDEPKSSRDQVQDQPKSADDLRPATLPDTRVDRVHSVSLRKRSWRS
jgi:hypothetical protein